MTINLNRGGYEPQLDYLKGVAILFVLLNHGTGGFDGKMLYPLWVEQAVPIFFLIEAFQIYKKEQIIYPNLQKLWHRLIKPFFIIQCIFILYYLFNGTSFCNILKRIQNGGDGPGSYYIWVYIQLAFLCPLLTCVVKSKAAIWIFFCVCILFEIFCSLVNLNEDIYRLLCIRYIFLIYLGYLWVKKGIVLTFKSGLLSVMSAVLILILCYTRQHHPEFNYEPLVFDTSWTQFHWFTYFLPWSLLSFIICKCYQFRPNWLINRFIILCGKRSYEIFLFQMLVFGLSPLAGKINVIISLLPLMLYERRNVKYFK